MAKGSVETFVKPTGEHTSRKFKNGEKTFTNLLPKALPGKCRDLSRIVEHYGHNRGIVVTKNLKTHLLEL
jgi:hypothetical protein